MAASAKSYSLARRGSTNYRFLAGDPIQNSRYSSELELDESDVWGGLTRSDSPDPRPPAAGARHVRRASVSSTAARGLRGGEAASLPVNIPDWSKILRGEYKDKWRRESIDGGDDDGGDFGGAGEDDRMPPHEYLARTRMASFSVHEGIGRTLKGRDLSMVRNAIWEKTGFQD